MPVNLSVKNVPDTLAERLRTRALRNHRSLQRELLSILESAAGERGPAPTGDGASAVRMSIDEVVERARQSFPQGTASSVGFIRDTRDGR